MTLISVFAVTAAEGFYRNPAADGTKQGFQKIREK